MQQILLHVENLPESRNYFHQAGNDPTHVKGDNQIKNNHVIRNWEIPEIIEIIEISYVKKDR